ncbi:integrase core domain-containing protein [Pseudoalteromonas phenolica]
MFVIRSYPSQCEITDEWKNIYNYERPHDSIGDMTPISFLETP